MGNSAYIFTITSYQQKKKMKISKEAQSGNAYTLFYFFTENLLEYYYYY